MARKRRRRAQPLSTPESASLWPEERIKVEAGRIRLQAVAGALVYAIPALVVAGLGANPPVRLPGYHVAIAIAAVILSLLAYIVMKLFDGVLIMEDRSPTKPRAALMARCILTDAIALAALLVFLQSGEFLWPCVIYAVGIPAAAGLIRRIPAYRAVMQRIARGEAVARGGRES